MSEQEIWKKVLEVLNQKYLNRHLILFERYRTQRNS